MEQLFNQKIKYFLFYSAKRYCIELSILFMISFFFAFIKFTWNKESKCDFLILAPHGVHLLPFIIRTTTYENPSFCSGIHFVLWFDEGSLPTVLMIQW